MARSPLSALSFCGALLASASPLVAQRVTTATLEARSVPVADTTITLRAGDRDLVAELRVPTGAGPHPVAIVIHGGCWVTRFADMRYMKPLAEGLRTDGFATWTISYRRADEAGGGWPGTFLDVAAMTALLRDLAARHRLDLTRVIASGHSAGAHLALWLAAQPRLPAASGVAAARNAVNIAAVVALDGPGDLVGANLGASRICGGNVLEQLLASSAESDPERWKLASPTEWVPLRVPQAMVRGSFDLRLVAFGSEPGSMPVHVRRAQAAGDSAWLVLADSTSHFSLLDPQHAAYAVVRQAYRDALAAIRPRRR